MPLKEFLEKFKPGIPVHGHLLVAALIWSVVGTFLMLNGFLLVGTVGKYWLVLLAICLGTAKALLILDRVAHKNILRLQGFDDGACVGSVYSWRTWLMVLMMILLGRFLRTTLLPGSVIGFIYLAVGWGLLMASRLMWLARFRYKQ